VLGDWLVDSTIFDVQVSRGSRVQYDRRGVPRGTLAGSPQGGAGAMEGGAVRLSLAVVTYRSSGVLSTCVGSFRREAVAAGMEAEVVVVDHSEDQSELSTLEVLPVDRLLPRPNRGFAAGVNLAVANSTGELVLIANPDTEFLEGSLSGMIAALNSGYTVVGPQLVWDREGAIHLPVPDDPAPWAEFERARTRRQHSTWERGLDGYLETLLRYWSATGPVEAPSLRGPALLLSRGAFFRLGPWDEGYFLYYEETEWFYRARRRGARLAVVGDARVHHAWGDATRHLERPAELEERSRQRFMARNYPPWWRLALRSVRGEDGRTGVRATAVSGPEATGGVEADLWLLSPWPHLSPAAGWTGNAGVPAALCGLTDSGRWYLAAARRDSSRWRVVAAWTWGEA